MRLATGLASIRRRLDVELDALEEQARKVKESLRQIEAGGRLEPPLPAVRLRQLMARALGEEPPFLCDLVSVKDEEWQDAVEGMLGNNRFAIFVPPDRYLDCAREYERQRKELGIHGVGLVDVERLRRNGRRSQANSLARQIETDSGDARAFVDFLLGDVIACNDVEEMRRFNRAVTQSCMVYRQFMIDHMDERVYEKWYIGQSGRLRQIALLKDEQNGLDQRRGILNGESRLWHERASAATPSDNYASWLQALPRLSDIGGIRARLEEAKRKLAETDWADIEALQAEVKRLRIGRDEWNEQVRELSEERGRIQSTLSSLQESEGQLRAYLAEKEQAANDITSAESAVWVEEATRRYTEARRQYSADELRTVYTRQRDGYQRRLDKAQEELHGRQLVFQTNYDFMPKANTGADDMEPYRQELARLQATELPRHQQEIAAAKAEAEVEFRENFIHQLREMIRTAQSKLDEINGALKQVKFPGTTYRFMSGPNPFYQRFYDLIMQQGSERMGLPLLEGGFYDAHKDVIDELFGLLTSQAAGVATTELENLCDYRRYLTYDIELRYDDGQTARFSKVGRSQSGGKTQTPYYVTMVAAFAQLYHVHEPHLGDTARLIVFDEAFNKMDEQHTESALDLMRRYQLQVVTATPPSKMNSIVPYMDTCLSVVRAGSVASVEPFYNRLAAQGKVAHE